MVRATLAETGVGLGADGGIGGGPGAAVAGIPCAAGTKYGERCVSCAAPPLVWSRLAASPCLGGPIREAANGPAPLALLGVAFGLKK